MPAHWYLICLFHLVARLWCLRRASRSRFGWTDNGGWFPFLVLYLRVGLADLTVWIVTEGNGPVPRIIAPLLILTQIFTLVEIARRMHYLVPQHPNVERHYRFAYGIAIAAIAATAKAVSYPEYPEWLFRAQLWVNVATAAGIIALLALYVRRPFRMYPEVLWVALVMIAWVSVPIWGAGQHIPNKAEGFTHTEIQAAWVGINETTQAVRIACLLAWGGIFRRSGV